MIIYIKFVYISKLNIELLQQLKSNISHITQTFNLRTQYEKINIIKIISKRLIKLPKNTKKTRRMYLKTLTPELRQFNLELHRNNNQISANISQIRAIIEYKQPKKVNSKNFDFDDLYRIGVAKMGSGVKSLLTDGKEKIRKGFGYAGNMMHKYIKGTKPQQKQKQTQPGNYNIQHDQKKQPNQGEVVNENADFNSYDIKLNNFKNYEPKAEQYLQQTHVQKQVGQRQQQSNNKKIVKQVKPRRKIFDRNEEQKMLARKRMQKLSQPSSQQHYSQQISHQQPENTQQSREQPKKDQKIKQNAKNAIQQLKQKKKSTSPDHKLNTNTTANTIDTKKTQKKQREIKQISVQGNKVLDLQNNDSESNQSNQNHKGQPQKQQTKESPEKKTPEQIKITNKVEPQQQKCQLERI